MPLMQEDIRRHYEENWKQMDARATDAGGLVYSSPVEDAVLYPLYRQLLDDLKVKVDGGKILDVGSGAGRWVRFFLEHFKPAHITGVDFTQGSVDLLKRRYENQPGAKTDFRTVDITQPDLDLGERFDLINILNVLFHIPEPDRFASAMANLSRHLASGGRIVTTEYMPRVTMRTNWMLVRSRYDFKAAAASAGLKIVAIRASSIFSNDPMGIDGPDTHTRQNFNNVRNAVTQIMALKMDDQAKNFFVQYLAEVETSLLNFCRERIADVDMPSQKLVVLAKV